MMYTAGKLYLFEICLKSLEILVLTVAVIIGVYTLDEIAYGKIVFAVLIPQYVTSGNGGFCEIVDEDALLRGELLKSGDLITEHLDVGETVGCVVEIVCFGCRFARSAR